MGKNIVVCCDGTGQEFEENKANPLRLHYCLDNRDGQVSFYDPGVGTFNPDGPDYTRGWLGDFTAKISETLEGGALGHGIVTNIKDAYRFLMNVYEDGDKVFIFGFSRGAFTAQSVAGLLNKCGLLCAHNENLIPYALQIYLKKGNPRIASEFKQTMARDCKPHCLGVWDTVKSLGNNHEDDFFYATPQKNSTYGYHAVSIDEQREDFEPSLWGKRQDKNHVEVWLPGVHSDVGGGYPEDGLANGALRWMIAKAKKHGVTFSDSRVREFKPDFKDKLHDSRDGLPWSIRGAVTREIPEGALIHKSAVDRMGIKKLKYTPPNIPNDYSKVSS